MLGVNSCGNTHKVGVKNAEHDGKTEKTGTFVMHLSVKINPDKTNLAELLLA